MGDIGEERRRIEVLPVTPPVPEREIAPAPDPPRREPEPDPAK